MYRRRKEAKIALGILVGKEQGEESFVPSFLENYTILWRLEMLLQRTLKLEQRGEFYPFHLSPLYGTCHVMLICFQNASLLETKVWQGLTLTYFCANWVEKETRAGVLKDFKLNWDWVWIRGPWNGSLLEVLWSTGTKWSEQLALDRKCESKGRWLFSPWDLLQPPWTICTCSRLSMLWSFSLRWIPLSTQKSKTLCLC